MSYVPLIFRVAVRGQAGKDYSHLISLLPGWVIRVVNHGGYGVCKSWQSPYWYILKSPTLVIVIHELLLSARRVTRDINMLKRTSMDLIPVSISVPTLQDFGKYCGNIGLLLYPNAVNCTVYARAGDQRCQTSCA